MPRSAFSFLCSVIVGAAAATSIPNGAMAQEQFGAYRNERHGFVFGYPVDRFLPLPVSNEDSRQFVSKDGNARILVCTLPNFDGKSLREYRTFLLKEGFAGADVTYAPLRDSWFVLSGTRNGAIFYQRVNFVCGGRAINSWLVQFPAAENPVYAPIVEQMHKAYRLGASQCSQRITGMGTP